jgi:formate dehydrogenase maturation protein FdhE
MRAEQSVKRDESVRESCPLCGSTNVRGMTRTTLCVYLRCEKCEQVWTIPERRMTPRVTDTARVF